MKTTRLNLKNRIVAAVAGLAITWMSLGAANTCLAQTPPPDLPPGVQDVVKLTKAGLSEDVILSKVKATAASYNLTTDQIIYLSQQGVPQTVISALIGGGGQPAPAPTPAPTPPPQPSGAPSYAPAPAAPSYAPAPAPAPYAPGPAVAEAAPVSLDYFQAQLGPYGRWVEVAGVGPCWVPFESNNPTWRPYFDQGRWVFTDQGWFWQSDYPWGEIAFHYGRWFRDFNYGWVWAPAYDWAPAWVSWRYAEGDGFCGWAPLPVAARFEVGVGLTFRGGLAVDVDFGLPVDAFVFIGFNHFWERDYHVYMVDRERVHYFYERSVIRNGYRYDHGRFVNEGLGRERMAVLTQHEVRVAAAHELRGAEEHRNVERRVAEHPRLAETVHAREVTGREASHERPGTPAGFERREEVRPGNSHGLVPGNGRQPPPGHQQPSQEKKGNEGK